MGLWKSNSLEHINMQFRSIMEGMGIDEEKQNKLTMKLNLSKKIKTIVSMQTLEERKKKIKEYVNKLDSRNSLLNLLSLSCSLESGPRVLYDVFMDEKGCEVLIKCMNRMDEESADALCDTLCVIINKYGNTFPPFLKLLLEGFVSGKLRESTSFFRILELLALENKVDELFLSTDISRCIFNTYFSKIIDYVGRLQKINNEPNFLLPLLKSERAAYVKYVLFVFEFHQLEPRIVNKDVYLEIMSEAKPRVRIGCKSDRISELLRIVDANNTMDTVCCIMEAFVFGDRYIFKDLEAEIEKGHVERQESKKHTSVLEEKMHMKEMEVSCPKPVKAKITRKIVKKTIPKSGPNKNYVQVKWVKMNKGNSIWRDISLEEAEKLFIPHEFDVFEIKVENTKTRVSMQEHRRETIFSEKKNYGINIALGRVKMSNTELKSAILDMHEDFDENLVKQLLLYFPSEDEVERLLNSEHVFGRGEEFFKECVKDIEAIRACLYYLYFAVTFNSQTVGKSFEILRIYYTTLLTSSSLKKFLGILLFVGNCLNRGTFLGNADGFTIDSIPVMLDLKNGDISFIDFVAGKIDKKQLIKDLNVVYDASGVNFEGLCSEMDELRKNYVNASGSSLDKIQERMGEILPRYEAICSLHDNVVRLHGDCKAYFGEDINEQFNNCIIMLLDKLSR